MISGKDRVKPLAKGYLAPYQQKDLEGADGELVAIWGGKVKNDSPVYLKNIYIERERSTTSSNTDV